MEAALIDFAVKTNIAIMKFQLDVLHDSRPFPQHSVLVKGRLRQTKFRPDLIIMLLGPGGSKLKLII